MRDINHIVIHCSAAPNGSKQTAEDIDQIHKKRGWRRIGYHYVITTDGEVQLGRNLEEIGAHVYGHNRDSIGICVVGYDRFNLLQWDSLKGLVANLKMTFPEADIKGHRDFSPDIDGDGIIEKWEWLKTCPGFDVATWLSKGMEPDSNNILGHDEEAQD